MQISFAASTLTCPKPQQLDYGRYESNGGTSFKLNEVITAVCFNGYYLWGEATKTCCELDNGQSAWLPKSSECSDSTYSTRKDSDSPDSHDPPECLTSIMYGEKCTKAGGQAVIFNDEMSCKTASEGR